MTLTYYHQISERREGSTINQQMDITVDYSPQDESIKVRSVDVIQDGVKVCEISKLLDKAEGEPLHRMIESIDWLQIYLETRDELRKRDNEAASSFFGNIMANAFGHLSK